MNPFDLISYLVVISVALCCGIVIGRKTLPLPIVGATPSSGPQIVVNVPPDFKPMETLPATTIEGARAVLYWTVFNALLATDEWSPSTIHSIADDAVNTVFGRPT